VTRTLRIVNYAVNGTGTGHLTRLVAINRWIRRYAACAGVRAEIYFLTSSEAEGLLFHERFAGFKLPSKTVVGDAGIDKLAYLALAKQWVWHSLGLLQPNLFIVDTFPRGAFGELLSALDLAKTKAFIYRPSKTSVAEKADFQAMLPLYDAVIVPEHAGESPVIVPPSVRSRLHHTGPIAVREPAELETREAARGILGIPDGRLAVYLSTGAGGDAESERVLLETSAVLLANPAIQVIVGAGPLYRGRRLHGERVTWLTQTAVAELMPAFDLAIAAAGYNTFTELMLAGVPTLFLPLEKKADDQRARAQRAVAAGAAKLLEDSTPTAIQAALASWLDPSEREKASAAARRLVPRNHARDAAQELLKLVLPAHEVDAAAEMMNDELLRLQKSADLQVDDVLTVMEAIAPRGTVRGPVDPVTRRDQAIGLTTEVVGWGVPMPAVLRLIHSAGRKLPAASPEERLSALRAVLSAFRPFEDWAGAATLLKVFGSERELTPADFSQQLTGFLAQLRTDRKNLYEGIALVVASQGTGAQLPSNREVFSAILEKA
jgi:predicted glycosyltransferase